MCEHENVTVRRAAAKTLTLISDRSALPFLLKALLNDADPVVQGVGRRGHGRIGQMRLRGSWRFLWIP